MRLVYFGMGLYECQDCGRSWIEWYARHALELHESMTRHELALGHRVFYMDVW